MPRISPARTSKDSPLHRQVALLAGHGQVGDGQHRLARPRRRLARPAAARPGRPSATRGLPRWRAGCAAPTTLPRRSTVIVSAIDWTSLSLCEMKMMDVPPSRSCRTMRNSSSVSAGVSTAVGSSRISTLACLTSALTISTRCWMPTGQVLDQRVRVHVKAVAVGEVAYVAPCLAPVEEAGPVGLLDAERDVLRDREDRHQHEVLVHHADAGRDRVFGRAEPRRLAVDEDLALVGLRQPVQDVHQRGLPRSVLAEQGVDLPRGHREADLVVGHERAEPLGDAPELKFHV